jgi:hypothetical protein
MNQSLRTIAIAELAEYMGAAAEFAVDDAIDVVKANPAIAGKPDLEARFFFITLSKMVPVSVPIFQVKEAIARKAGLKA